MKKSSKKYIYLIKNEYKIVIGLTFIITKLN